MASDTPVEIKLGGKAGRAGIVALVSKCDEQKASEYTWYIWNGYANANAVGALSYLIIGDRPADVPSDWVVDHIDNNKLNNCRSNLRWVSESFNAWNKPNRKGCSSKFRGVTRLPDIGKWMASFRGKFIVQLTDERAAGRAAAKAAVREYGEWAMYSPILVGPDLFSADEMLEIKAEVDAEAEEPAKPERKLPKGVYLEKASGKYVSQFRGKVLGKFSDAEEAERVYNDRVKEILDKEWSDYAATPIKTDKDGHAVIALSGTLGTGNFTKVPAKLWHKLTYKNKKWGMNDKGYAVGNWEDEPKKLHLVIYALLNPDFKSSRLIQVDHIVAENKLDNREENLRLADRSAQARNKTKKEGCSSKYVGVQYIPKKDLWSGTLVLPDGKTKVVYAHIENDAAIKLNAIRLEFLGPNATLNKVVNDDGTPDEREVPLGRMMRRNQKSRYMFVIYLPKKDKWQGSFKHGGRTLTVTRNTENEAAIALNALRVKHLGDKAVLINVVNEDGTPYVPA